jgi:hypothetical protein
MNRQHLFWQGKGECLEMFARLTSANFFWHLLGDEFPAFLNRTAIPAGKINLVPLSPHAGKPGLEKPKRLAKNHTKSVPPLAKTGVSDESMISLEFPLPEDGGRSNASKRNPAVAVKQRKYK